MSNPNSDRAEGAPPDDFITESSGNVFLDLGRSEEEATKLMMRAELMHVLREHIEEEGLTQQKAAEIFGVTQPRVSDLVNGKAEQFSLETLISFATRAGAHVGLKIEGLRVPA